MAFSINTNISSLQAQYYLNQSQQFQAKTINEVTSGLRIVNAGDDAAGLAVANQYRSNEAVLTQGIQNLNSATSTLQTIDSGMSDIGNLLDRARTLATESASDTFTGDRGTLNNEFQSVLGEIDREAQATGVNTGGTFAKNMQVFVGGGDGSTAASTISNGSVTVDLSNATVDTKSLGLTGVSAETGAVTDANASTYLSGITTAAAGSNQAVLTFSGVGFSDAGGAVTVNVNLSGVNNMSDLANAINSGIAQAANESGSNFAAFKNAGITASVDTSTTGSSKISFTAGSAVFQVSSGTASGTQDAAAEAMLGGGTGTNNSAISVDSGGVYQSTSSMPFATMSGGTQAITVQAADSTGVLQNLPITLDASVTTIGSALTEINSQLQSSTSQGMKNIVAVADSAGTGIDFLSSTNFNVNVAAPTAAGTGITAGAYGATVSAGASTVDISTAAGASNAVSALANAVTALGSAQAIVGKSENTMNYASGLASTQLTNMASSESQIRDADLAAQAANLSKAQILMQAGVAALAQANSAPQAILSLLKS
jgi:flagellin